MALLRQHGRPPGWPEWLQHPTGHTLPRGGRLPGDEPGGAPSSGPQVPALLRPTPALRRLHVPLPQPHSGALQIAPHLGWRDTAIGETAMGLHQPQHCRPVRGLYLHRKWDTCAFKKQLGITWTLVSLCPLKGLHQSWRRPLEGKGPKSHSPRPEPASPPSRGQQGPGAPETREDLWPIHPPPCRWSDFWTGNKRTSSELLYTLPGGHKEPELMSLRGCSWAPLLLLHPPPCSHGQ